MRNHQCYLVSIFIRLIFLDVNILDPMMTEPDLVTIGDCANIDDASIIAHINTRGTFRLHTLQVGS